MRRTWLSVLALVAVLGSSLPVAADGTPPATTVSSTAPAAADTRERFFGAVQAIYNPDRAAQAGVQWERLIFPWSLIQKSGPTTWSDGYFSDHQVQQEAARGIQIIGLATYTPQWASSTPQAPKPTNVPSNLYLPFDDPHNYWGQFMFTLAQHYKDQINTWVIWNEPDMYSDMIAYTWDGSITDLFQLVKVASQAVKKASPEARIALPGLTYWWDKEGGRPLYLARFLEAAAQDTSAAAHGDYFDIVVLHQYSNPLNTYATIRLLKRALAQYGLDRPIWVGESNAVPNDDPTNPISPAFHATMDQQAAYIIEAFALARAAGAERMSIYKMVDEAREGPSELYGLVRNDGSIRPAFTAYQTAVRYMSAPTSAVYSWDGAADPPTDDQVTQLLQSNAHRTQWLWPAAVNRVTLERGAERVTIVWNASPKLVTAHIPAVARSTQVVDKFGRDTGEAVAQNGQYELELQPSSNNTDPRDPSVYLVGGDPRLLVEKVAPLPTAVDATIQAVWPRDTATANLSGLLLGAGSTQPVPCRWNPSVRLFASIDGGRAIDMGPGTRRMQTTDGATYPVWDFNSEDISAAAQGKSIDFWMDVNQVVTHATRWTYTANSDWPPFWAQRPTTSCSP
ncbi:MAG: hypothetical protein LC797_17530 [Chloroflexi bacterium]|nr:hypothetical protein [Chloroflexota bacterium]